MASLGRGRRKAAAEPRGARELASRLAYSIWQHSVSTQVVVASTGLKQGYEYNMRAAGGAMRSLRELSPFFAAFILFIGTAATQSSSDNTATAPSAPLPLPASPETTCTGKTFHEAASKAPSCSDTMYGYKDPVESCCVPLAEYYGVNSTLPSRNCFCYEPYWTRLQELEESTYIGLMAYLDFCGTVNHTIAYFQAGEGPCAGKAVAAADSSEPLTEPKARSVWRWVRDLQGDGLMAFSFTLGLISAVGFSAMLWPLVIDSVVEVHKLMTRHRSSLS